MSAARRPAAFADLLQVHRNRAGMTQQQLADFATLSVRAVRDRLGLDLPVEAVQEVFAEYRRRGLMFLDGSRALALALPAVTGR